MRDYLEIGPGPAEEACAQVGTDDYATRARAECTRFIALIRATCGDEPDGARLDIKRSEHDFGSYVEVAVYFDSDDEAAVIYAYRVEKDAPTEWPS